MTDLTWKTADELSRAYRSGDLSPVDAVEAALARVEEVDARINSMVTVTADRARAEARAAEARLRSGEDLPPLFGVPVTVKDLVETAGVRTTYGATYFRDNVPEEDALAWSRLKQQGVILIGKTTTPEYGLLGVTESHLTGSTSTPWDVSRNSGGSSGGAASGVAAGIVPIAWGSDGGGSIRVPSSLCGVVGIKPSVGRIPHAENADPDSTDGPIARSVLDAALMLDATAGRHPLDRFTLPSGGERYADAARRERDLTGLRVAASYGDEQGAVHPDVRHAFAQSLSTLRDLGAEIEEVRLSLPDPHEYFIHYWGPEYITYADMAIMEGEAVWPLIKTVADAARRLTPAEVSAAHRQVKTQIYLTYAEVFQGADVLVTPTTPVPALPHDGDMSGPLDIDGIALPNASLALHRLTEAPSHAGLPALTVPNGFTAGGLPTGLQFIGPLYDDLGVISIAAAYERATSWHLRHPSLEREAVA